MALILSRADIQRCLNMAEAIEAMRIAFSALSAGLAQAPQRMAVGLSEQGIALLMPSLLQTSEQNAFGLKVVTVMPQNPLRNLPRIIASVLLLDATTGKTQAILRRWVAYRNAYWRSFRPGNFAACTSGCRYFGAVWSGFSGSNAGVGYSYSSTITRIACSEL